ncbi:protein root primordium defective 1, partial [Tanacetum coccineum]
ALNELLTLRSAPFISLSLCCTPNCHCTCGTVAEKKNINYFQVNGNDLELVCWSSDLAVSVALRLTTSGLMIGTISECECVEWSRFKKALLQYPGIFYVSSKLHTHTVVLREAYKRDVLVTKPRHPVMTLRSSYIHLMNIVMEKNKSKNVDATGVKKKKATQDSNEGEGDEFSETESEHEEDDSDFEDVSDSDSDIEHIDNEKTPTKKTIIEDHENNNRNIRGRTVKFYDSPRRNTPNSRSS